MRWYILKALLQKEFARLESLTAAERAKGREIVVVVGVGFVGAVMVAKSSVMS